MSEIEYFYSAHSAYAYLGSRRFMRIARAAGRRIRHRPVFLRPVIEACGAVPFKQRSKAHIDYYFRREIERWAEFRDAPVMQGIPTHHHKDMTLANCLLIAAVELGEDVDELAHVLLEAHWRDDADLADRATLLRLAAGLGLDAERLLEVADAPRTRDIYDTNNTEAVRRSVFGSPTYFADGDMFYGQDRLEILERALQKPFAGVFEINSGPDLA